MEKKRIKLSCLLILITLLTLTLTIQKGLYSSVNYDRPVVMIDVSKSTNDSYYEHLRIMLSVWGFDVAWNNNDWTSNSFVNVDILIVPTAESDYTTAELGVLSNWFSSGNKSLWVAGHSDDGNNANYALRANDVLETVNSSIYIESGSLESIDVLNNDTKYINGNIYNTDDQNTRLITANLPYKGNSANALFYGPTTVIGKNKTNNEFINLETSNISNVGWIIKTTESTFLPNTLPSDAGGAQVHTNNQDDNFVIMAMEHSAGDAGTGRIIVSGEAPFSTFKSMFKDEFGNLHNNYYIVYNTMQWFKGFFSDTRKSPVVMIDLGHSNYNWYRSYAGLDKIGDHALSWGFNVILNNDNISSTDLIDVDILIIPIAISNYTNDSLIAISNWFASGNKGIWVAGDSDYGGYPQFAIRANNVLNAVNSSIFMEQGEIESDNNFGGGRYRVSGTVYNTNGSNAKFITSGLPYQGEKAMALFHGPTDVIGKNHTNGEYVDLITTDLPNVEWVVKATNSTFNPATSASEAEARIHQEFDEGDFVLMALQHSAGPAGNGKIIASGSDIFSDYKNQFNDPGEFGIPQNDYYIVFNAFHWLSQHSVDLKTSVMIDLSKIRSIPDQLLLEDFASKLSTWGYNVIWNDDDWSSSTFDSIDIFVCPIKDSFGQNESYDSTELEILANWFATGNKGVWIGGDNDWATTNYSIWANQVLDSLNSSIFLESMSIESDYNFGGGRYRVGGTIYNTNGTNAHYITERLPLTGDNDMALFHGPTSVIGKNRTTGEYLDLETNNFPNVEWVVKAKNATFVNKTIAYDAEGVRVHEYNQTGEFVLMALQHSAGYDNSSKIIVSGESIFSTYKNMFNPMGEFNIAHNDYYLVYNTMNWLAPILTRPVTPHTYIIYPEAYSEFNSEFVLRWQSSQFHAPSFTFDVIIDNKVAFTTIDNEIYLDLDSGEYEIQIRSESLYGFVKVSEAIVVFVDKDSPLIDLSSSIANGTTTTSTSMMLNYNLSDGNGLGIDTYEIFIDGLSFMNGTADNANDSLSLTDLTVGSHTINIVVNDMLGNTAETVYTFIIESPPITTETNTTESTGITSKSSSASSGFEIMSIILGIIAVLSFQRQRK
ncbi:MAG: hypothetical protein ACXAC7_06055 [Candidatus Hodarchaeales archaeon]|jgi:hypothetical protein